MTIHVERLTPELAAEWDAYVAAQPNATCHHLAAWLSIAERVYDLRARLVVARDAQAGRAIRGALALISVPRPFGHYLTTGLFGAYGPVLADDEATSRELLEAARLAAVDDGARFLHVKLLGETPTPPGFIRQDIWVTAMLPLDGGAEQVWRGFKSSIRAAVRQGMRAGFEQRSGPAQLDPFYDVLAENMHRKGAPVYGRAFLRALLDGLGPRADVVTLWKDGRVVSGALTIAYGGVMYVPFASSLASHFHLRPNNLLYWRVIERACAAGLGVLDFGTSMRDASTLAFKLHWGAAVRPAPSLLWTRGHEAPTLVPVTRALQTGVAIWKRLPRTVADALGPRICRMMV